MTIEETRKKGTDWVIRFFKHGDALVEVKVPSTIEAIENYSFGPYVHEHKLKDMDLFQDILKLIYRSNMNNRFEAFQIGVSHGESKLKQQRAEVLGDVLNLLSQLNTPSGDTKEVEK